MSKGTEERLGLPAYKGTDGREGGVFIVRTLIPQSLAEKIRARIEIEANPQVARQIAERVILEQMVADPKKGIDPKIVWENGLAGNIHPHRMKPPYENLPPSHRMFIIEPSGNPHEFIARKLPAFAA